MRTLIAAELRSFWNLFRARDGQRVLVVNLLALLYFAFLANIAAGKTRNALQADEVVKALRSAPQGVVLPFLLSLVFIPVTFLVFMTGLKSGQKLLFSGGEVDFLMASPVPRFAILLRAWLRLVLLNFLWACALNWALIGVILGFADAPAQARLLVPVANLLLVLPVLALMLAFQVVILRWFSGPRFLAFFGGLMAVLFVAVLVSLLFGLLGSEDLVRDLLASVVADVQRTGRLPLLFDAPAAVVAAGAGVPLDGYRLAGVAGLLLAGPVLLFFAAALYPRALENERISSETILRRRARVGRGRPWPASVAASLFRKDLAMILRQPGRLLGLFMMTLVVAFLANSFGLPEMFDPATGIETGPVRVSSLAGVPDEVRQATALLTLYVWILLMNLPGTVLAITSGERRQWPLLSGSPLPARALLRGKLRFPALTMAWFGFAVAGICGALFQLHTGALAAFALLAFPVGYGLLGVSAAVGTLPMLARPTGRGETGQVVRSVLTAMLVMAVVILLALPGSHLWNEVKSYFRNGFGELRPVPPALIRPLLLTLVGVYGFAAGWLGFRIAVHNFKQLLGAAPE